MEEKGQLRCTKRQVKASVADRMAAMQKKASFREPPGDAAPPAKRAPSTSVAERMAAMQRKASEAADATPAAASPARMRAARSAVRARQTLSR